MILSYTNTSCVNAFGCLLVMIAFNSTYFYFIVCYAHRKIFLLYMRNLSFIFIYLYLYPGIARMKSIARSRVVAANRSGD